MFFMTVIWFLQIIFAFGHIPEDSVKFFFHNTDNISMEIKTRNLSIPHIDTQKSLKILCHGLAEHSSVDWYTSIINAYASTNHNVIAVDWASYSSNGYIKAISVSEDIGVLIGRFIIEFTKCLNFKLMQVHLIGHSLGAHIAGFAGKYVLNETKSLLGRITGLDPAGPLFNIAPKTKRLCDDDAVLVDVIHTDAGVLGILPSIGTVDFYPNGGANQSRCTYSEVACNHKMVTQYFIESIGNSGLEAVLCDSYGDYSLGRCNNNQRSFMGDSCQTTMRGDYFLNI